MTTNPAPPVPSEVVRRERILFDLLDMYASSRLRRSELDHVLSVILDAYRELKAARRRMDSVLPPAAIANAQEARNANQ